MTIRSTRCSVKPKITLDLDVLKLFLTFPEIFRHHADIALYTRGERRAVFRALTKLLQVGLVCKHRSTYYFNIDLVGAMYGRKTEIRKSIENSESTAPIDFSTPIDLALIKHFLSDAHGWWSVPEIAILFGKPTNTIQYNIDALLAKKLIIRDNADHLLSKTKALQYKLAPNFAMSLHSDKATIQKTIQETIQQ